MTLSRRYPRSLRENRSFYLSTTFLTILTLFLFYLFNIAGTAILDFADGFYASQAIEDAHFSTYLPIPDDEIAALEEQYGVTLERQSYANIETDGTTARVFSRTEKVDRYAVTGGRDVEADDEVIVSEGYCVSMDVALGGTVRIGGKDYTVVGYFQRPDYLYMLENEDDSYKNITTFFLAYLTDAEFAALGQTNEQYLVRYNGHDTEAFRRAVHETYTMRAYTAAADNARINMVARQAEMFVTMSYILLVVLPLVAVALICIIIGRRVKSEQRLIGTLSALGYKKRRLMWHYALFAALPGLAGGVLTLIAAALAAQPFGELGLQDYEPMHITAHLAAVPAALGVVIPTALYVLAALLAVRKLLRCDTVVLLAGAAGGEKRLRRMLAGKKCGFRIKFALRSLVGNPARSFVVLLGVFLGCYIMLLSFALLDTFRHTADTAADALGSFEHQYVLNRLQTENPYGGAELLAGAMEDLSGNSLTVIGTDDSNPYLTLKDSSGADVALGDGYYLTSLASAVLGREAGDTVTLRNPLTLAEKTVTITGVVDNDVQRAIFTTRKNAEELTGLPEGSYNALVSAEPLDSLPASLVAQESARSDAREQVETMITQMGGMIYVLVVLGALLCVAAIYVAVDMMVAESRSSISMLKVLGYRDRQIDRIVLNVHHLLLPIGIAVSIPAVYASCREFWVMFTDYGVMRMHTYISPKSYVLAIGLTGLSYFGSLWLLRRKVKKVNMIESLKDNRE